jgi:Uma2 family endonuclease
MACNGLAVERENRAAYLELDTLPEYVLVEQDRPGPRVVHRSADGSRNEASYGPDDIVPLPSLGLDIAMQRLYEGARR